MSNVTEAISLAERYGAHNYHPLPVVIGKDEIDWAIPRVARVLR